MTDLSTRYMGIELDTPVIVSSSGITGSIEGIRLCQQAGAGAVVLKSMFEELIIEQSKVLEQELLQAEHPEAYDYIRSEIGMQMGPKPYLQFIEKIRCQVDIPVIASVNCTSEKWWIPYAKSIESAGANALELNISHFPKNKESSQDIEKRYAAIVKEVCAQVSIPVAVKLGFYFTSLRNIVADIVSAGAQAVVLFNRYYSIDVDLEKQAIVPAVRFSSNTEMNIPLRWIGLLSKDFDCDIAATTGIHDGGTALKMIMVGAQVVQLCSALYQHGITYIQEVNNYMKSWLSQHHHSSIDKIRGVIWNDADNSILLKRLQYIQALEDASEYKYF